jgi:hypothetical protein
LIHLPQPLNRPRVAARPRSRQIFSGKSVAAQGFLGACHCAEDDCETLISRAAANCGANDKQAKGCHRRWRIHTTLPM